MSSDTRNGRYFEFSGVDFGSADQTIGFRGGEAGRWSLFGSWLDAPHNFSNKAQTPYIRRGPGVFEVPANIPITVRTLATSAAQAPNVVAMNALAAEYQRAYLQPAELAGAALPTGPSVVPVLVRHRLAVHQRDRRVGRMDPVAPGKGEAVAARRAAAAQRACGAPPSAPRRFEKVPMPASENETLNRRSCGAPAATPKRPRTWYSATTPQHCAL